MPPTVRVAVLLSPAWRAPTGVSSAVLAVRLEDTQMTDTEHNRRTALRMLERISQGIIDDELVTEDVYWWVPGQGNMTRAEFSVLMEAFAALHKAGAALPVTNAMTMGQALRALTPPRQEQLATAAAAAAVAVGVFPPAALCPCCCCCCC